MTAFVKTKLARLLLYGFLGILAATHHNIQGAVNAAGPRPTNNICTRSPHNCTMMECAVGGVCIYTGCPDGAECWARQCGAGDGT